MSLGDSHCRLLEVEVEVFEVEVDIDRGILSELLKDRKRRMEQQETGTDDQRSCSPSMQ